MGLRMKLNLMLLTVFVLGLAAAGYLSNRIMERNAREEVLQNGRLLLAGAHGAAQYTVEEIKPLLNDQLKQKFLPQAVSFYAANRSAQAIRAWLPEYTYRTAALNPTNLSDRSTDWEASAIREFRNDPARKELIAERQSPTGLVLDLFQPVIVSEPGCLSCHSRPEAAPKALVAAYGANNGFGWKMNEVVGVEVASVPMSVPLNRAHDTLWTLMAMMAGIFLCLLIVVNVFLHFMVVRPLSKMQRIANEVSLGKAEVPEYVARGSDEIASLGNSFNRMRRSLESALKLLHQP